LTGAPPTIEPNLQRVSAARLEAINDGDQGVRTTYTVKAGAIGDGLTPNDVAMFTDEIRGRFHSV
jgi:hypothetical protein